MQEVSGADFHEISSSLNSERINWLQVHGMKNTETVREICEHFEINFLVLQDILNANHPTKIEEHDNYIVLILKDNLQVFMKMRRRPKPFIIMEKVYVRKVLHVIMSFQFIFPPH